MLLLGIGLLLISVLVTRVLLYTATSGASEKPAIDSGLILRPETVVQQAAFGNVHARFLAAPLIPGVNHFTLKLDDHGKPIADARITMSAAMPGMRMQTLYYSTRETSIGVYAARGSVAMFGRWRFDLRIQRPHAAPVHTTFMLFFNVPLTAISHAGS